MGNHSSISLSLGPSSFSVFNHHLPSHTNRVPQIGLSISPMFSLSFHEPRNCAYNYFREILGRASNPRNLPGFVSLRFPRFVKLDLIIIYLTLAYELLVNGIIVQWRVGYVVTQLVEALCYKPEGRGFDSRWCHWNFLLT
jgi:hypothetical protein